MILHKADPLVTGMWYKSQKHQQKEMENLQDRQATQTVVSVEQIEDLIGKGWRLVAILPQGKAVCIYSESGL